MRREEEILRVLPGALRQRLQTGIPVFERLQELRFRVGRPLAAVYNGTDCWVAEDGTLTAGAEHAVRVSREMIREMLEYISSYSFYAFEEEVRGGFITIPGGHRIGLAGKAVTEGGNVRTLRNISFLNVRLAHQVVDCARPLLPFLYQEGRLEHVLLISPPRFGKTTLLRDLIRLVSDGNPYGAGVSVSVVDERAELAACYQGIPQNDLGARTDVLDSCPKARGISMMLRAMAPAVIAVDELGTEEDIRAVQLAMYSGCAVLATAHGGSAEEIRRKPLFAGMMEEGLFGRLCVLTIDQKGRRGVRIYDGQFRALTEGCLWY